MKQFKRGSSPAIVQDNTLAKSYTFVNEIFKDG
jgi:hypothetical protein